MRKMTGHTIIHRLMDACEPLFLLVNELRATDDYGSPEDLKKYIDQLVSEMEDGARGIGVSSQDINDAKYAIAVFIDETILGSSWSSKDIWMTNPLQLQYFGDSEGGLTFFNKLEEIRRSPYEKTDLIEIYYLCLVFGFEGKFKITGRDKLKRLIDEITHEIKIRSGHEGDISPSWRRKDEIAEMVKGEIPSWIVVATCISIGLFVFLIFYLWLGHSTDNMVDNLLKLY